MGQYITQDHDLLVLAYPMSAYCLLNFPSFKPPTLWAQDVSLFLSLTYFAVCLSICTMAPNFIYRGSFIVRTVHHVHTMSLHMCSMFNMYMYGVPSP